MRSVSIKNDLNGNMVEMTLKINNEKYKLNLLELDKNYYTEEELNRINDILTEILNWNR
ncbi:TPA: hypothetical protein KRL75_004061 [Clostridioides difficile]|nr:hypothetical protein [Clostridioides difficile]HBG8512118.1 hypothetical protein [Clostridioides difficile]HBH1433086.1 hypothetical protein [Clostridioides difficile]HBH1436946.1 hypothetical protein [Clostridioides difficile]